MTTLIQRVTKTVACLGVVSRYTKKKKKTKQEIEKTTQNTSCLTFLEILQKMNTKNRTCMQSSLRHCVSILVFGSLTTVALLALTHAMLEFLHVI